MRRTVGVIYYNLDAYREIARTQGVAAAEAAMDFVAGMLQIVLRDSDPDRTHGRGRFLVCVVLLKERQALLDVARRIERAMRNMRLEAMRRAHRAGRRHGHLSDTKPTAGADRAREAVRRGL
ncbi:MAG: hypothetical protein U1E30_02960 [Rhodoblastus sp.]